MHHYSISCHTCNIASGQRSTTSNVIEYLHEVFTCFDSPHCYNLVSFHVDFHKAFDKGNHHLLQKTFSWSARIKSKAAGKLPHRQTSDGPNWKHHIQTSWSPQRITPTIFTGAFCHLSFLKTICLIVLCLKVRVRRWLQSCWQHFCYSWYRR